MRVFHRPRWLVALYFALAACALVPGMRATRAQDAGPVATEPVATEPAATEPPAMEPAATASPTADLVVEIVEPVLSDVRTWTFAPNPITVPAGSAVTWVMKGIIPHTVTAADASGWDSGLLTQGAVYQRTFDTPGEFPYLCNLHEWMTGTVVVTSADTAVAGATVSGDAAAGATGAQPPPSEPQY